MSNGTVQQLLAFLQPQSGDSVKSQSGMRLALAQARAEADTITEKHQRDLWLVLLQLISVQLFNGTV